MREESRLSPPLGQSLIGYVWGIWVVYLLNIFLSRSANFFWIEISQGTIDAVYAARNLSVYNGLRVRYVALFTALFAHRSGNRRVSDSQVRRLALIATNCTVAIQLCLYLLTHIDSQWQILAALLDHFLNLREVYEPSWEVGLLAATIFLNSVVIRSKPISRRYRLLRNYLAEFVHILREYYFYIGWSLALWLSFTNDSPTLIKFFWLLIFLVGSVCSREHGRLPLIVLFAVIVNIVTSFVFEFFVRDCSPHLDATARYLGLYFDAEHRPDGHRAPLAALLLLAVLSIVVSRPFDLCRIDPDFERRVQTRLYRAACAAAHHLLPVIVQLALYISTMHNPSVFG
jgi:hypothetical protein